MIVDDEYSMRRGDRVNTFYATVADYITKMAWGQSGSLSQQEILKPFILLLTVTT